jgi:hypothetical protein
MRTFPRLWSAALLATVFHLACTPFEVAKDAGTDAMPDKVPSGSADDGADTQPGAGPSTDAPAQEAPADAPAPTIAVPPVLGST